MKSEYKTITVAALLPQRMDLYFFLRFAAFCAPFLLAMIPRHLFDGTNVFKAVFLEVLDVQLFDKLGQRQLPGFLLRVGKAAELLRIQAQLSGHLDVGMRKVVALPRIDPSLVFFRYLALCQRTNTCQAPIL